MDSMLQTSDFVGVTFWIISVSMVASTFFFFSEANNVGKHWGTSVRVAGLHLLRQFTITTCVMYGLELEKRPRF